MFKKIKKNIFKNYLYYLPIIFIFIYFIITITIEKSYLSKVEELIHPDIKTFFKKNIFIINYNSDLLKIIETKNSQLKKTNNELDETNIILRDLLKNEFKKLIFERDNDHEKGISIKLNNNLYDISFFKANTLTFNKQDNTKGNSYIDSHDGYLYFVSANGIIAFEKLDKILKNTFEKEENSKIELSLIDSNIDDVIKYTEGKKVFFSSSKKGIKDLFIENDKIYLSFTNESKKDCFNTSIIVANLNFDFLNFEIFFEPEECININKLDNFLKTENMNLLFNAHQGGGRIVSDGIDKLYFTIGDYRVRDNAQKKDSIFGKILSINKTNRKKSLVSMGHRNSQGLYYDRQNKLIYFTDHGPEGGDEVNVINSLDNNSLEVKNYGWPISSYGNHYGTSGNKNVHDRKILNKKYPFYKSHKDYGFIEPITFFSPSIGISEIIKLENDFLESENIELLVGAMGHFPEEGDQSIHHITLDSSNNVLDQKTILLNERVRDMMYDKDTNTLILSLDLESRIAIIRKIK